MIRSINHTKVCKHQREVTVSKNFLIYPMTEERTNGGNREEGGNFLESYLEVI